MIVPQSFAIAMIRRNLTEGGAWRQTKMIVIKQIIVIEHVGQRVFPSVELQEALDLTLYINVLKPFKGFT